MVMPEGEKPKQQPQEKTSFLEGRASCQFVIEPDNIPTIYANLMKESHVVLYDDGFPEPFPRLVYEIGANPANKTQIMLRAVLTLGDDFKERYGSTVGSEKNLARLLRRYSRHEFSNSDQQLVLYDKNGQVQGAVFWAAGENGEDGLVIQKGGQAGDLSLSKETPVRSLSSQLDDFSTLVQRYIQAIWNNSPETDRKKFSLTLNRPVLAEGALEIYSSTFEIVGQKLQEIPRKLNLGDIGGYERMKAEIKGLFIDQVYPERSRGFGSKPYANRFILVTGPEGVGKSLFPKPLYWMLREHFGNKLEYFRLPLRNIILENGYYSVEVVKTVLDRLRRNEERGIPTLFHLDSLDALVIPRQQMWRNTDSSWVTSPPSDAEVNRFLGIQSSIISTLQEFGRDLGAESHNLIIYGESRLPREQLPEAVQKTFRRTFSLPPPTREELVDILKVQMKITKEVAQRAGKNPFSGGIELRLDEIASQAVGLVGSDIKDALINIANNHKAKEGAKKYPRYPKITPEEIIEELGRIKLRKGVEGRLEKHTGFNLPHQRSNSS